PVGRRLDVDVAVGKAAHLEAHDVPALGQPDHCGHAGARGAVGDGDVDVLGTPRPSPVARDDMAQELAIDDLALIGEVADEAPAVRAAVEQEAVRSIHVDAEGGEQRPVGPPVVGEPDDAWIAGELAWIGWPVQDVARGRRAGTEAAGTEAAGTEAAGARVHTVYAQHDADAQGEAKAGGPE